MIALDYKDETVRKILQRCCPGYSGRNISCKITDSISFHSTNWSGGYRRQYTLYSIKEDKVAGLQEQPYFEKSEFYTKSHEIPEGLLIVVLVNSGQRVYVEIHCRSELVTKRLESKATLSWAHKVVLCATASLKSSYAGIKDYRFHEANQRTGINKPEWDQAKAELIELGFLFKNGAITVDGRNVDTGGFQALKDSYPGNEAGDIHKGLPSVGIAGT